MRTRQKTMTLMAVTAMVIGAIVTGTFSLKAEAAGAVKKVEYDEKGEVEVDFTGRVRYSNPSVTVKDANGKVYTAKITERDDDELEFRILNYKTGMKYTFTIKGIKRVSDTTFGSVTGTVTIPKAGWAKQNGKWFMYGADGKKATGWVRYKGDWYYLNSLGVMQTGWLKYKNNWYYFDKDGEMETGWEKIGGKWYYFDKSGVMVTGKKLTIGKKTYTFKANGVCANP